MKDLEEEFKKQHEYESPINIKPFNNTSDPGNPEFVITQPNEITKPVQKLKMGGIFNEFSWQDSSPPILTPVRSQGKKCAASYAFAVIAGLESAQALENKEKAKKLSV